MNAEVEHYKEFYSFKSCPNAGWLQDKSRVKSLAPHIQ